MSSREDILARLRKNTRNTYDKPEVNIHGIQYDDPVAQFIHVATTAGGARLMELKEGDDLNAKIREAYPDARVISSNVPTTWLRHKTWMVRMSVSFKGRLVWRRTPASGFRRP